MSHAFQKLDPAIQRRLVASSAGVPVERLHEAYAQRPHLREGFNDYFAVVRAGADADLEAMVGLLDAGVDPNRVANPADPNNPGSPLICAIRGVETHGAERGLPLVEMLLSRGADPNGIANHNPQTVNSSPMHSACCLPSVLERLLDRGGNARLRTNTGWSVLDEWLWYANSMDKNKRPESFRALFMLQEAGLDLNAPTHWGSHFLVVCWGSGGLRPHIPALIAKGLDPHRRGAGKGAAGVSLVEHLGKKTRNGKGGELAQKILADLNAQALEAASSPAQGASSRPRL